MTLTLMLAAIVLAVFAITNLPAALGFSFRDFSSSVATMLERGLGPAQLIPGGLLLLVLVAAPLLLWGLWQEWTTSYTVDAEGLTYRTGAGVVLRYPWSAIRSVRTEDGDEAITNVYVQAGGERAIRNPLVRWLHRTAIGVDRIPIYAGVEERDELVARIVERAGLPMISGERTLDEAKSLRGNSAAALEQGRQGAANNS